MIPAADRHAIIWFSPLNNSQMEEMNTPEWYLSAMDGGRELDREELQHKET